MITEYIDGHFVGQKWVDLAEILQDYNHQLELRWIPPEMRTEPEERKHPYAVVHRDVNGSEYVVTLANEAEDPAEVLTRVINNDMKHGDVFDRMQTRNNAYKMMEMYRKADELAAKEDMAGWLMKGDKNWRQFRNSKGELVKLDDRGRQTNIRSHH